MNQVFGPIFGKKHYWQSLKVQFLHSDRYRRQSLRFPIVYLLVSEDSSCIPPFQEVDLKKNEMNWI